MFSCAHEAWCSHKPCVARGIYVVWLQNRFMKSRDLVLPPVAKILTSTFCTSLLTIAIVRSYENVGTYEHLFRKDVGSKPSQRKRKSLPLIIYHDIRVHIVVDMQPENLEANGQGVMEFEFTTCLWTWRSVNGALHCSPALGLPTYRRVLIAAVVDEQNGALPRTASLVVVCQLCELNRSIFMRCIQTMLLKLLSLLVRVFKLRKINEHAMGMISLLYTDLYTQMHECRNKVTAAKTRHPLRSGWILHCWFDENKISHFWRALCEGRIQTAADCVGLVISKSDAQGQVSGGLHWVSTL